MAEYDEDGNEVEHNDDTDEQENSEPDVPDPFDRVYANVPSESHMLPSVPNCKHCDAKKFEGEPPGFCCRGGKIRLSNPDTPPELMRLWTSESGEGVSPKSLSMIEASANIWSEERTVKCCVCSTLPLNGPWAPLL